MTASMRRGMLCISCWHSWGVTSFQQVLMASFSCSQVFGWCLCNFFFTIPHKFSTGFKSGELAGQSNTCTWQFSHHACVDFAECGGARSCWKMNSLSPKSWSAAGTMKYSRMSWETAALTEDLRKQRSLTPADDIAPQTITDCGNFTFRLRQPSVFPFMFNFTLFPPHSGTFVSKRKKTNLDSSENMTEDHCSVVFLLSSFFFLLSSFFSLHHFSHFCRCLPLSKGFTAGIRQRKPCSCSLPCAVRSDASTPVSFHIPASRLELQNRFFLANLANWRSSLSEVDLFRPQFCHSLADCCPYFVSI